VSFAQSAPLAAALFFHSHCNETGNEIGHACVNENAVLPGAHSAAHL